MNKKKLTQFIPLILFFALGAWILYYIISYDNYYYGDRLKRLNAVVKEGPVFLFDSEGPTYYYFTLKDYNAQFRISEGSLDIVRKDKHLTALVEAIKGGDSIAIDIRQADTGRLASNSARIRVIGLNHDNKQLIGPLKVKAVDKDRKMNRYFSYVVVTVILLIVLVVQYIKRKKKSRITG